MYPSKFGYLRAASREHALDALAEYGEGIKVLAGGASLIPLMKLRLAQPPAVLDIGWLDEMAGVRHTDDGWAIGACTHHADVLRHSLVTELPVLSDVAGSIGDAQVRNMGTVGGSVGEVDPAGDWAPALLALGAVIRVESRSGGRTIDASAMFVDAYTSALRPDELITEIVVPPPGPRTAAAHAKFEIRAGDFAVANCTVHVSVAQDGRIDDVRVGLGGVALVPQRVQVAEDALRASKPTPDVVRAARQRLEESVDSFADVRGSADYRRHLGGAMFERALRTACTRATHHDTECADARA